MRKSYRQQAAHSVGIHVGPASARDDFAALHDEILVGERAREVVVLLDQQDRHVAAGGERPDRPLDVLDDRGLDAFGRLIEHQNFGSGDQRTPDGELLLLASREVTAAPAKATVGDSIVLAFRLYLNERDQLTDTVPAPAEELPGGIRVLSVERLQRGRDRVFTGRAVIALYRTGVLDLPAFGVPWVQVVTGHRGIVKTGPATVEIDAWPDAPILISAR